MPRGFESLFEILRTVLVVLIVAFAVRAFVFQPFVVEGQSMEPTFHDRDYLIVNKYDYRIGTPKRGDVIVFQSPTIPNTNFIKRIIGLPGEVVKIDAKGVVSVDDKVLGEPYINHDLNPTPETPPIERFLQPNEYWVMGDNRNHSSDSRDWGPLQKSAIIGRAWVTVFPKTDFGVVQVPSY